jgi:hypothetical protein
MEHVSTPFSEGEREQGWGLIGLSSLTLHFNSQVKEGSEIKFCVSVHHRLSHVNRVMLRIINLEHERVSSFDAVHGVENFLSININDSL